MMSSPFPTLGFSMLYLLFLWAGPCYMQHRDAFKLRKTLIIYNFSMVLLNFYICKEVRCYPSILTSDSLSITLSLRLSISPSPCLNHPSPHQSIHISVSLSITPPIQPSLYLSFCPFKNLLIHLSTLPSIRLSPVTLHPSPCPSPVHHVLHLSIPPSYSSTEGLTFIPLYIHPSLYSSIFYLLAVHSGIRLHPSILLHI